MAIKPMLLLTYLHLRKPRNKKKGKKKAKARKKSACPPVKKREFTQEELDDPLFSDEEDVECEPPRDKDTYMIKHGRSVILAKIPDDVKRRLKNKLSTAITVKCAEENLGLTWTRLKHVIHTEPVDDNLRLSDSAGYLHMYWRTPQLPESFLSDEETGDLMTKVAGFIRDQGQHEMCCFYALSDLISSSAVLHGQLEQYEPLSEMYICQNADPQEYARLKGDHNCDECSFYSALKFAKESRGIPLATAKEMSDKYKTLEQALQRLKTHTVSATLLCYKGWTKKKQLYIGPRERSGMVGLHEVIMLDCVKYQDKMAIKCKSSNEEDIGVDGYIYVDPHVMFIEVGSSRKKKHEYKCRIRPTHLLFDFYSIDMEEGTHGKMAIKCKSSNGKDVGEDAYIYTWKMVHMR
ncbi:hypothetical protein Bca52824_070896 [Brassica carinata]|uniref:Uncharacterized protein n=1 Tax=Brassica carinata TaxID=52824 RepID=A0A8X7Q6X9_BRACI|nr:hypothetical protein Bca52824_070896 [Brassica carinata]